MSLDFVKIARKKIKNNQNYARTGCTVLDCMVGGGEGLGFPYGWIVNIVGDKSAGKSFLAVEILIKNIYEYVENLIFNYDDHETGFTFDTKTLFGVDIMYQGQGFVSKKIEELDGNYANFLKKVKSFQKGIYISDTIDGLSNKELEERSEKRAKAIKDKKEFIEGSYNVGTASFLSKEFFRTKAAQTFAKNVLLIMVSQVRMNMESGMFKKKFVRSGGKGMDHWAHTCLWLWNVKKIVKKMGNYERVVGVIVRAVAEKSKTPRPYGQCVFSIYFDHGIDDIGSSLDFLYDLRGKDFALLNKAEKIYWKGVEPNLENLKNFLVENKWEEKIRADKKEEIGSKKLSIDFIVEWLERDEIKKKKMCDYFGESISRDNLIFKIDNDKKMREELEIRVIAKWEEIAFSMKTNLKRKY